MHNVWNFVFFLEQQHSHREKTRGGKQWIARTFTFGICVYCCYFLFLVTLAFCEEFVRLHEIDEWTDDGTCERT